eukprot:COSAG06_NODE_533_length_14542_cov_17.021325_2_plen_91_part_00
MRVCVAFRLWLLVHHIYNLLTHNLCDIQYVQAVLEWAEEMREDEDEEEDVKEVLAMAEKLIAHCEEELEEDSDDSSSSEDESVDDDDDEE